MVNGFNDTLYIMGVTFFTETKNNKVCVKI